MSVRNFNNVTTIGTLVAPVAASATSISVQNFNQAPPVPFTATIDRNLATEEIILVTAQSGGALTVIRGYDGTAAQSHSAGSAIEHTAGAIEYTEANGHVNASVGVHGTTGDLVGSEGEQTLFDKTLVSPLCEADVAGGDAVVAYIPAGAEVRNLFRGIGSDGLDKIVIDSSGKITVGGQDLSAATASATALPTASTLVKRDSSGAAQFTKVTVTTAPAAATDAAPKSYVDTAVAPKADKTYVDTQDAAAKTYTDNAVAGIPKIYVQSAQPTGTIADGSLWFQG